MYVCMNEPDRAPFVLPSEPPRDLCDAMRCDDAQPPYRLKWCTFLRTAPPAAAPRAAPREGCLGPVPPASSSLVSSKRRRVVHGTAAPVFCLVAFVGDGLVGVVFVGDGDGLVLAQPRRNLRAFQLLQ